MEIQSYTPRLRAVSVSKSRVEEFNSRKPWTKVLTPNHRRNAVAGDYIVYILNDITLELPDAGEVWVRHSAAILVSNTNFYMNFKKGRQTSARGEYDITIRSSK